jgi:transposase
MSDERADPTSSEPSAQIRETPHSIERARERFDPALPDCPLCGTPIWAVSVIGPLEATVSPCGCTVTPGRLETDSEY